MFRVLLLVLIFHLVVTIETDEGLSGSLTNDGNVSNSNGRIPRNLTENEKIELSLAIKNIITLRKPGNNRETNDDEQLDVRKTAPLRDNDYQTVDRALDTFNEKLEHFMNNYRNEMSFVTTKLNHLSEKLNKLEIIHHEIDQVISHQNVIEQKLYVIQESVFGSQSFSSKFDRLEMSMQQLHVRIDELIKQKKASPSSEHVRRKIESDDVVNSDDEQFTNCESKIEQLVGFVHSFAELNRLESTDILNRLGNMQSQLIQFFDAKESIGTNQISQRNLNGTKESVVKNQERFNLNEQNSTDTLNNGTEINSTDSLTGVSIEKPSSELHLNDDSQNTTSNITLNRKQKRAVIVKNRLRKQTTQRQANSSFDNPKQDVEVDSNVIGTSQQVSAKYGQPSQHGCHQFANIDRSDEIQRFPNQNGFTERLCSYDKNGIGWTVIQSRDRPMNALTPENFNRSWNDYKIGFGNLSGEFWYGNDLIHKLTYDDDMELKIVLDAWDGRRKEFQYEVFRVDSEKNRYNLFIAGFRGNNMTLDAMLYHHNQDFSTFDRKNDQSGIDDEKACCSCAKSYASGWWFNNCIEANLNGVYRQNPWNHNYVGIVWEKWLGDYSLKATKMMIRPKIHWDNASGSHNNNDENNGKPPDDP